MKNILIFLIASFGFLLSCSSPELPKIPQKYTGNWFDPQGQDYLALSVSPHFVLHEGRFWNIEKVTGNENAIVARLSDGNMDRKLKVDFVNDSVIRAGGKELYKNHDGIRRKPKNKQISLKGGKAVVMGHIKNHLQYFDSTDRVRLSVSDYILGTQKNFYATIDSTTGLFNVSVDLTGPQDIYFQYHHRLLSRLFLHPGDTLIIFLDSENYGLKNDNTQFAGAFADVNYDLYYMRKPYEDSLPPYQEMNKALCGEPEEYYEFRKYFLQEELQFLEGYCSTNNCSETFKTWFRKNAEVHFYKELMNFSWKSFKYGMGSPTRLEGDKRAAYKALFMDSLDHEDSLYQLSAAYFLYLNPLSQSTINFRKGYSPEKQFRKKIEVLTSLVNNSPENKFNEYSVFLNSLSAFASENEIPETQKEKWWQLEDKYEEEIKVALGKLTFDWLLSEIKKAPNQKLQDLYLCMYFNRWYIENSNLSTVDYAFHKIKNEINNKEYLEKVTALYRHLKEEEKTFNKIVAKKLSSDKDGDFLLRACLNFD